MTQGPAKMRLLVFFIICAISVAGIQIPARQILSRKVLPACARFLSQPQPVQSQVFQRLISNVPSTCAKTLGRSLTFLSEQNPCTSETGCSRRFSSKASSFLSQSGKIGELGQEQKNESDIRPAEDQLETIFPDIDPEVFDAQQAQLLYYKEGKTSVFKVFHKKLNADVIVKILNPAFSIDSHGEKFRDWTWEMVMIQESCVALDLSHIDEEQKHFVQYFKTDLSSVPPRNAFYYTVQEYGGERLDYFSERIWKNYDRRVGAMIFWDAIIQAAEGLLLLEKNRMSHNDIKPTNLVGKWMDGKINNVKIIDFEAMGEMASKAFFHTSHFAPQEYLSMEPRHQERFRPHYDIYSLGMTFISLVHSSVSEDIPNLLDYIDADHLAVLMKMIHDKPSERWTFEGFLERAKELKAKNPETTTE